MTAWRYAHWVFLAAVFAFVYLTLATAILVGYMAGFLLVAFHPKRQAVHDLLAKTLVYIKSRAPAGNVVDAVKTSAGLSLSRHR